MNIELNTESLSRAVEFSRENYSAQLVVMQAGDAIVSKSFDPSPVDVFAVQKGLLSILSLKFKLKSKLVSKFYSKKLMFYETTLVFDVSKLTSPEVPFLMVSLNPI